MKQWMNQKLKYDFFALDSFQSTGLLRWAKSKRILHYYTRCSTLLYLFTPNSKFQASCWVWGIRLIMMLLQKHLRLFNFFANKWEGRLVPILPTTILGNCQARDTPGRLAVQSVSHKSELLLHLCHWQKRVTNIYAMSSAMKMKWSKTVRGTAAILLNKGPLSKSSRSHAVPSYLAHDTDRLLKPGMSLIIWRIWWGMRAKQHNAFTHRMYHFLNHFKGIVINFKVRLLLFSICQRVKQRWQQAYLNNTTL